jgi:hypothetical protein
MWLSIAAFVTAGLYVAGRGIVVLNNPTPKTTIAQ